MKSLIFTMTFLMATSAMAYNQSIGAILGAPVAVTGQYKLDDEHWLDAGFGWSTATYLGTRLYADYLWMFPQKLSAGDADLDVYAGVGGAITTIQSGDDKGRVALAPRAPLGIKYVLADSPVEIFGEIAPMLNISPSSNFALDIGLGARYQF